MSVNQKYKAYLFLILILALLVDSRADIIGEVHTDQATYTPNDTVNFKIEINELPVNSRLKISYYHLGQIVDSVSYYPENSSVFEWQWLPPVDDFKGYLAVISLLEYQVPVDTQVIAVDISSDWTRFPRYGFLSDFSYLSQGSVDATIVELNRYHINGLQYYDWQYKHHLPLKGTPENPAGTWPDIANRTVYFATVKRYIDTAHKYNMKSMAYNLLFGAYEDAQNDGVQKEWRLFRDAFHSDPDFHDLPDNWASDIYLIDPSNPAWKNYIFSKMSDVFEALPFDGWHIDQLGDRGTRYNYSGQQVDLSSAYLPYLEQAKEALQVPLVMNAVNQYGQTGIAQSPVDFLYTEVWGPNDNYVDLVSIILDNYSSSGSRLATVLAAYMNYSLSSQSGYFNTAGVLLTDAVIFAAGGAHLELGEHMLANEYFPNNNLLMTADLNRQLTSYYDFLVAYQNILRDGGEFNQVLLKTNSAVSIRSFGQTGSIWNFSRQKDNLQIFHLINFTDAKTLNWRDNEGDQPEPAEIANIPVFFTTSEKMKNLWIASPDFDGGLPLHLPFTQSNDTIWFEIPHLKYWDVIVAEYDNSTGLKKSDPIFPNKSRLLGNYPNPFNPETKIEFQISENSYIKIDIINQLGQSVDKLTDRRYSPGLHKISWKPEMHISSGIYFCLLNINDQPVDNLKLLYIK